MWFFLSCPYWHLLDFYAYLLLLNGSVHLLIGFVPLLYFVLFIPDDSWHLYGPGIRMHGWSVEDSSLAHILSVITTLFYVSITCCTENLFNLSKQGNMSLFIFILSFSQGQRHLMAKVVLGPTWLIKKKNYTK